MNFYYLEQLFVLGGFVITALGIFCDVSSTWQPALYPQMSQSVHTVLYLQYRPSVLRCVRPRDVGPVCAVHQLILWPLLLINTAPSDHFYSWPPSLQSQPPSFPLASLGPAWHSSALCQVLTHLKKDTQWRHIIHNMACDCVCYIVCCFPAHCIIWHKAQFTQPSDINRWPALWSRPGTFMIYLQGSQCKKLSDPKM